MTRRVKFGKQLKFGNVPMRLDLNGNARFFICKKNDLKGPAYCFECPQTWAEFSALDVGVLVCALQLLS